jgi:8-oxo-dGTP pyrophosphatase MutT (NUDIX family)
MKPRNDRQTEGQRVFSGTVSIKGVIVRDGRVLLVHNERDEWELPGGRLEVGETPPECVAREITEETGWQVDTGPILDSWLYYIDAVEKHVLIVTYGCHLQPGQEDLAPVLSHEHSRIGLFSRDDVPGLIMPQGYKDSIATWFAHVDPVATDDAVSAGTRPHG